MQFQHGCRGDVVVHPLLGIERERHVDPVADHVTLLGRHAEQGGDHVGRHLGPEVLHVVERAPADQGVEQAGAEGADVLLELDHAAGRERLGDQPAVAGVLRRVHEDHDLHGRPLGRDHLHHGAVRGAERLRVAAEGIHVGEAAHGVEVVLLVVIERRLVTETLPDRMGVDLVLLVEGIPGERFGVDGGHDEIPSGSAMHEGRSVDQTPRWWPSHSLIPPRMPARVVDHGDALEHLARGRGG